MAGFLDVLKSTMEALYKSLYVLGIPSWAIKKFYSCQPLRHLSEQGQRPFGLSVRKYKSEKVTQSAPKATLKSVYCERLNDGNFDLKAEMEIPYSTTGFSEFFSDVSSCLYSTAFSLVHEK